MWSRILFFLLLVCQTQANNTTVRNNREFFEKYVLKPPNFEDSSEEASFYAKADVLSPFAPCELKDVAVEVLPHPDIGYLYWPTHVYAKKCQGGCSVNGNVCKSKADFVRHKVRLLKVVGEYYEDAGEEIVQVYTDTACSCGCKQVRTDCSSEQQYVDSECRCACKLEQTCDEGKRWDRDKCKCVCRGSSLCSDDECFNKQTCNCVKDLELEDIQKLTQHTLESLCPLTVCPHPLVLGLKPDSCMCQF